MTTEGVDKRVDKKIIPRKTFDLVGGLFKEFWITSWLLFIVDKPGRLVRLITGLLSSHYFQNEKASHSNRPLSSRLAFVLANSSISSNATT
jgi:hypothetical protein